MPDFTLPAVLLYLPKEWQQCIVSFLKHTYEHSYSNKTLRTYKTVLVQFFTHSFKHPEHYTPADIETFIRRPCQSRRNPGGLPTTSTRNHRLCVLSALYKFATLPLGRPVHNPTLGVAYAKLSRPARKHAFTEAELERFFAVIPTDTDIGLRDRAIYEVFFWTGKRREEIARLRYGDIETCIFVEDGHARAGYRFRYIGKGKGHEVRYAELPRRAMEAVNAYLLKSGRLATIRPDDPLFVAIGPLQGGGRRSSKANAPLHSDTIAYHLKRYTRLAGLDERRLSLHSLRHTAATLRYIVKPDILALQKFLDHASVETTLHYVDDLFGESDPTASLLEEKFAWL